MVFYACSRNFSWGTHVGMASTLTTESLPQLRFFLFFNKTPSCFVLHGGIDLRNLLLLNVVSIGVSHFA